MEKRECWLLLLSHTTIKHWKEKGGTMQGWQWHFSTSHTLLKLNPYHAHPLKLSHMKGHFASNCSVLANWHLTHGSARRVKWQNKSVKPSVYLWSGPTEMNTGARLAATIKQCQSSGLNIWSLIALASDILAPGRDSRFLDKFKIVNHISDHITWDAMLDQEWSGRVALPYAQISDWVLPAW